MNIKHPEAGDLPALTGLWQQAFGDSAAFIEGFFRTGFSSDRAMVAEEKGQLCAALYWFDCFFEGKKLAYIYAVATREDCRGRGICAMLMGRTHLHLAQNGYAGALLVPGEEGLVRMYEKMGYRVCCPTAPDVQLTVRPEEIHRISPEEYSDLRKNLLPPGAVVHTEAAFLYLHTFAHFYRFPGGIGCGSLQGSVLHLQEQLPAGQTPSGHPLPTLFLSFDGSGRAPAYFGLPMN